ncbi:MAG TPA: MFS transporter, partial [Chloroflexota bacterium]
GLAGRRRREDVALGLLFTALVLLFSAAWARNIFVPLQVTEAFGLPATAVGPAFTATAVAATLLMPTLGQITPRVGTTAVLLLGALLGIGYCTVEALLQSYPLLLLNQTLLGAGIAIWTVGGLLMAQEIAPDRAGTASATYVGAAQLAPVVSAVLLGGVAEVAGIRGAFLFGAGLGLLAATLIGLLARLKPR